MARIFSISKVAKLKFSLTHFGTFGQCMTSRVFREVMASEWLFYSVPNSWVGNFRRTFRSALQSGAHPGACFAPRRRGTSALCLVTLGESEESGTSQEFGSLTPQKTLHFLPVILLANGYCYTCHEDY